MLVSCGQIGSCHRGTQTLCQAAEQAGTSVALLRIGAAKSGHQAGLALGEVELKTTKRKPLPHKIKQSQQGWHKVDCLLSDDGHCKIIAPNNHVDIHTQAFRKLLEVSMYCTVFTQCQREIMHDVVEDGVGNG